MLSVEVEVGDAPGRAEKVGDFDWFIVLILIGKMLFELLINARLGSLEYIQASFGS